MERGFLCLQNPFGRFGRPVSCLILALPRGANILASLALPLAAQGILGSWPSFKAGFAPLELPLCGGSC